MNFTFSSLRKKALPIFILSLLGLFFQGCGQADEFNKLEESSSDGTVIKDLFSPQYGESDPIALGNAQPGGTFTTWHSDDEKELGQNPVIGSISLGAERMFKLRHKQYKTNGLKHEILLRHGSFLLMQGPTQHHWMHEIPRTAKPIGPQINLTFRIIK